MRRLIRSAGWLWPAASARGWQSLFSRCVSACCVTGICGDGGVPSFPMAGCSWFTTAWLITSCRIDGRSGRFIARLGRCTSRLISVETGGASAQFQCPTTRSTCRVACRTGSGRSNSWTPESGCPGISDAPAALAFGAWFSFTYAGVCRAGISPATATEVTLLRGGGGAFVVQGGGQLFSQIAITGNGHADDDIAGFGGGFEAFDELGAVGRVVGRNG